MQLKECQFKINDSTPSNLINDDEPSQMSLNPSQVFKNKKESTQKLMSSNSKKKKRLKFDCVFQDNIDDGSKKLQIEQSEQDIQIQFYLSNAIKGISVFFKSQSYAIFYTFTLVAFLVNCTLQAAQINTQVMGITQKIDLGLQVYFSISILLKFVQYEQQHAFWMILDILTNLCGYLAFGFSQNEPQRYFKALKTLRLLLIVKQSSYLKVPATKLINSLSSVGKILLPAAMFIYFYAVIGLFSFRDYQYSRCRDPSNKLLSSNWTVYSDQVFLCGQKQCPIVGGVQYQCLNPIEFGVQPNPEEVNNIVQGNGLMRYNNIFYSLFSTFKQTFITGSSRIMILNKQVINYIYVLTYYLSFIYLLAYIYLNIIYGLMMSNEEELVSQSRESSFQLRLQRSSSKRKTIKDQSQMEQKQISLKKITTIVSKGEKTIKLSTNKQNPNVELDNLPEVSKGLHNINEIADQQKSQFDEVIDYDQVIQEYQNFQKNAKKAKPKRQAKLSKFGPGNQSDQIKGSDNKQMKSESSTEQVPNQELDNQKALQFLQITKKYYIINHVIIVLCAINILIDYEGQSYGVKLVVDSIDFIFYWIYFAQVVFRVIIHRKYVPNQPFEKPCKLDFILFALCTGGLFYQAITAEGLGHFILASDEASRLLRTLKYLRIFILISSTPYFIEARIIFNSTLEAVYSVRYLSALWLLVLIIFSIMGYHMFQGKTKIDRMGDLDLQNGNPEEIAFEGILDSIIYTVFIFFNEEWDWFLFEQYVSQSALVVIWQLIVLVIGLQVLSKYFMALLMKELGEKLNQEETLAQLDEIQKLENQKQIQNLKLMSNSNQVTPAKIVQKNSFTFKLKNGQSLIDMQLSNKSIKSKRLSLIVRNGSFDIKSSALGQLQAKKKQKRQSMMRNLILGQNCQEVQHQHQNAFSNDKSKTALQKAEIQCEKGSPYDSFSAWQKFKIQLIIILRSKVYVLVKAIYILISIVCTIGMHPHKDPQSTQIKMFQKIWYATVIFFGLQIILSILAFGLFKEKVGYLKNMMNWIYVTVFAIQIMCIISGLVGNTHLQAFLSFRVIRVFFFIELKYQMDSDMRLTIVGFWKLLPKILNLLAITLIMYGFFAIFLVKLYKEDFYYCDGYDSDATIITSKDCMSWGGSWVQRKMNASNIFKSLLYLFLVATTQGWSVQVVEAASLAGQGFQPKYGENIWIQYFFSVFFFIGNLIMLNVFIGLSVYNFQKIKSQVTGIASLSKDNKIWLSIKNTIYRLNPKMKDTPLDNRLSQYVHTFKNSRSYIIINVVLFILFMISMSLHTTNMSPQKQQILHTVFQIFIAISMFQYLIQWIALGTRTIKHRKFIFQTIGVIYFIILFVLDRTVNLQPKQHRIIYGIAFWILAIRYFTLLNEIQYVRKMINSLATIFPQTANIWLLIFLVLFVYGVIGIYFFGYLKIGPQLNQFDQNYTSLGSAIYSLIKFSTLESPMLQIIESTQSIQPNSVCFDIYSYSDFAEHGRMGCGNKIAGYIFFLSFLLIYTFILLSTLLAVIVDAYSEVRRQQQSMVNKFQLQEVQKQWQSYDPQATGYICYRDFWIFTAKLVKIYKVNKQELMSQQTKQSFLKSLQIPIYEDQQGVLSFQFHEVVQALTRIVMKQKMGSDWDTSEAEKVFKNNHNQTSQFKLMKKSTYDSSHVLSLIILKSGLKVWKRKAVNVNVNNHQNLQNLFDLAKKQKQKAQINTNINQAYLNTKILENQNKQKDQQLIDLTKANFKDIDVEKSDSIELHAKQKVEVGKASLNLQMTQPQSKQLLLRKNQKFNLISNQDANLPNEKEQGNTPKDRLNKNQKNKGIKRMDTAKQVYSKVKSPRIVNLNGLYSQRTNYVPFEKQEIQDKDIIQLQKIE